MTPEELDEKCGFEPGYISVETEVVSVILGAIEGRMKNSSVADIEALYLGLDRLPEDLLTGEAIKERRSLGILCLPG